MENPYLTTLRLQQAMFRAMATGVTAWNAACLRFMNEQTRNLERAVPAERQEDKTTQARTSLPKAKRRKNNKKKAPTPCCGPDLKDHYGKRVRDVDVERL